MGFTKALGTGTLDPETLKKDKKSCIKAGPCGLGERAMYLNSFYIDRQYYVLYEDVQRVFKRVAMSKGGFSGKGVFSSMAYLVVQYNHGEEKACKFKFEDDVDVFLKQLEISHPEIPTHSVEAEARLKKAQAEEEAKYVKNLSKEAEASLRKLDGAREMLERRPAAWTRLSAAAKQKRSVDNADPTYKVLALIVLLAAVIAAAFGLVALIHKMGNYAIYFLMFGFAFIFLIMASNILPTGRRNKKSVQREWDNAVEAMEKIVGRDFIVPAHYAHPTVLRRMERAIRQGRAETTDEALQVVKDDLKALNKDVTVSQKEYDEVVEVKPLFLLCSYE